MSSSTSNKHTDALLLAFLKKKESLTRKEFGEYWLGPHADLVMKLDILKSDVQTYDQAHANDRVEGFLSTADWDGAVMFGGDSGENLVGVFLSEEYQSNVGSDEANFIAREKCQIFVGDVVTFIG